MMLSPYRVLDLTDERGQLAGAILAQLGAEVIAIEPPGGSRSRSLAPFAGDEPGPETSLRHRAYNRGKKSVVLDLAGSAEARAGFLRLVEGADVLIESSDHGEMEALGLDYEALARVNRSLVYTSISAFGRTGPKADWAATDLTVWAAAGPPKLTGDSDRAPLTMPCGQAFAHGAAEAAGATIAALYERGTSGHGEHIDVSAQQASAQATQSQVLAGINGDTVMAREAGGIRFGEHFIQLLWPCADGHVSVAFLFGTAIGPATARLMSIVHDKGYCDAATRDKDWIAYGELVLGGIEPAEEYERVKRCVGDFCMAHTKAELLELGLTHRLLIAPVNTIDDVVNHAQFSERDYFDTIDGARYPGPIAKLTETPLERGATSPALGADTDAVRRELASVRRRPHAPTPVIPVPTGRPLEGLKVLDFMWVMAGPAGTRVLADLGATVVRVESETRIETGRTIQPFKNGENALETSVIFANLNAGKLDFAIDPTADGASDVIHELVRWADVVTESFSPRAMRGFGLHYEALREINPDIVMLSSCLFGQTGPISNFAGYGTMAAAVSGFFGVTGWPDRAPSGPFGAYTDYISPRFANAVLLAAVDHHRRTGQGQYIDFAQAEGSMHMIAPLVLDYEINGRVTTPVGNASADMSPHGIFPTAGDDDWVAIACPTDDDREALTRLTGGLDDETIAAWTSTRTTADLEAQLQAVGVPCHRVADGHSITDDPQLAHREHFVTRNNASAGDMVLEASRFRLSRMHTTVGDPPTLGQHTTSVLTDILGYDDERMVELLVSGALA